VDRASHAPLTEAVPSLADLFRVFLILGMTSFGGGLSGWIHREIVVKRRWLSNERLLAGIAMGQVLPGPNSTNLALYVGLQMRGGLGATVCALGILGPPFLLIILMGALYVQFPILRHAHFVFSGMAAAGVGMTMVATVKVARALRGVVPFLIAAIAFAAVGVEHLPLIPVAAVMIPVSIFWAYRQERAGD
jgi:chromate transporter